jgi:Hsp70 protein
VWAEDNKSYGPVIGISMFLPSIIHVIFSMLENSDKISWRSALATQIDSIQQKGHVDIISNNQGHRITPSWVSFTDDEHLIGDASKNTFHNPQSTLFNAKREHIFNCMISLCKH